MPRAKALGNESHTLALSTRTNDGAIDGQVCFIRQSFDDPVKPRWSTTGSMGPLMDTNKAAWGCQAAAGDHLGLPGWLWLFLCNTEHTTLLFVSLWMVLPAFGFPPTPNAHPL